MDIKEILTTKGIVFKNTNNPYEILIQCTSGEHSDTNASLSYNLDKDIFNCWSCGFRGGSTKFLASIGVTEVLDSDSKQPYKIRKLKDKIANKLDINTIKLPDDRIMVTDTFKGVLPKTLKEFEIFTTEKLGLSEYICIPVYQFGKLKFIEGRLQLGVERKPKYNRKPEKSATADCLFPLDKIGNVNYVILVEGIFDMINMWQHGFTNTLCIFGSGTFSNKKIALLDRMGVTRVDILMDPDAAGQKAAKRIEELLDKQDIFSRNIILPSGLDPGDLTKNQAEAFLK